MHSLSFFEAFDLSDNVKAPLTPSATALRPQVGCPCGPVQERGAYLQGFRAGLVLWFPGQPRRLVLGTDGRLGYYVTGDLHLSEPLAPATHVTMRWQPCERGTLLWTAPTGWLALFAQRWALPLEAVA